MSYIINLIFSKKTTEKAIFPMIKDEQSRRYER